MLIYILIIFTLICVMLDSLSCSQIYVLPVHFVLDQHAELSFYSASSLKQQSAPLRHIILIPSQPVFALSP
jgi:hypothetical protein